MVKQQYKRQKNSSSKQKNPRYNYHQPIRVFVDGDTEIAYFNRLNDLKIFKNITFQPKIGKEQELERAILKKEICFIILDIDNHGDRKSSSEYKELARVINKYSSKVYFVNFSFETWILLHRTKNIPVALKKEDYDRKMKKHFRLLDSWSGKKDYCQRKLVMEKITRSHFNVSLENAKSIENKDFTINPSTSINKFFDKISKINEGSDKNEI